MDRAQQAGIDDNGLGILFGLYDWRFEVLAMIRHTNHLEACFNVGPHTISFPRIKDASGLNIDTKYFVDDDTFEERLRAALADDAINAYVSPLVNYSLDDDDMRFENPVTNTFTVKALYRLGFQWSITETHYLEQAIQMMEMLGFFDL